MEATETKTVSRIDYYPHDSLEKYISESEGFTRDPSTGYLKGTAIVTNVGVFPYMLADGSIINEARFAEEVFHPDSITSLKMLPLTNDHPNEAVTSDNIKKYQVGNLGSEIIQDQYHLAVPIVVTDTDTISDVINGKRALSCGYTCDIENTSGVFLGVQYDAIQRNIRYNHVALVDRGRAGDAAKIIKRDSSNSGAGVLNIENKKKENEMSLKKINLDGVDYEAEAKVIETLTQLKTKIDTVEKEKTAEIEKLKNDSAKIEAERDQSKEALEKLKADFAELEKTIPEKVDGAVKEKIQIMDAAIKAGVEVKDQSNLDLMKAVILKVFPASAEKLDKADETYIKARFDGAVEMLAEKVQEQSAVTADLKADSISQNEPKQDNATEAYKRMKDDIQNRWKKDKGGK